MVTWFYYFLLCWSQLSVLYLTRILICQIQRNNSRMKSTDYPPIHMKYINIISGRWWRTGKPGVLQSMGSKRVGHDWVTEQWYNIISIDKECTVRRGKWEKSILKIGSSLANKISNCKCCLREEHNELWIRKFSSYVKRKKAKVTEHPHE